MLMWYIKVTACGYPHTEILQKLQPHVVKNLTSKFSIQHSKLNKPTNPKKMTTTIVQRRKDDDKELLLCNMTLATRRNC